MRWILIFAFAVVYAAMPLAVQAADPERGARLYATAPAPGLLACADCHSEDPTVENFGNIWSGRNGLQLLQRAVQNNTGGMGYFLGYMGAAELSDIAAYLGNTPRRVTFEPVAPGAAAGTRQVSIRSSLKLGMENLQLTVEGSAFELVSTTCADGLPRFSSCLAELRFRPPSAGSYTGALVISHRGTPTPVRVVLEGAGKSAPTAMARVQPAELDFPALAPARRNVWVINESADALRLGEFVIEGDGSQGYTVVGGSCAPGLLLRQGQRCVIAMQREPVAIEQAQARLRIQHDAEGGVAIVSLRSADAVRTSTSPWKVTPRALRFGTTPAGGTSAMQLIQWTALEQGPAPRFSLTDSTFQIAASNCDPMRTLRAGQHCLLGLRFMPGRVGAFSGALHALDAQGEVVARVSLSGQGLLEDDLLQGKLSLDASSPFLHNPVQFTSEAQQVLWSDADQLQFGLVVVGARSGNKPLRLANRGTTAVNWQLVTVVGNHSADFLLENGCTKSGQLAPGAECELSVQLVPGALGLRQATLAVWTDAHKAPLLVTLQGHGVASTLSTLRVDALALDFGTVPVGSRPITRRVRWQQLGGPAASVPRFDVEGDFQIVSVDQACLVATPKEAWCTVNLGFAPVREGQAHGKLKIAGNGNEAATAVALTGRGALIAPLLTVTEGASSAVSSIDVGQAAPWSSWRIINRGSATSEPLRWVIDGADASDFQVDTMKSTCHLGLALQPGQGCDVSALFRPRAPGTRVARWVLGEGDLAEAVLLQGRAFGPALPSLVASPGRLVFQSRPGSPPQSQDLLFTAEGPTVATGRIDAEQASAFMFTVDPASPCAQEPMTMLPSEACAWSVNWNGAASGLQGGRLQIEIDQYSMAAPTQVFVTVAEDPALRLNQGAAAGAFQWTWAAGLALAAAVLAFTSFCWRGSTIRR
jgi:hypothetical protein